MQDPVGYYYNPAQLGYYSQNNSVSIFFMPDKTVLFNNDPIKTTSYLYGATAGYNFKTNGSNTPLLKLRKKIKYIATIFRSWENQH